MLKIILLCDQRSTIHSSYRSPLREAGETGPASFICIRKTASAEKDPCGKPHRFPQQVTSSMSSQHLPALTLPTVSSVKHDQQGQESGFGTAGQISGRMVLRPWKARLAPKAGISMAQNLFDRVMLLITKAGNLHGDNEDVIANRGRGCLNLINACRCDPFSRSQEVA